MIRPNVLDIVPVLTESVSEIGEVTSIRNSGREVFSSEDEKLFEGRTFPSAEPVNEINRLTKLLFILL